MYFTCLRDGPSLCPHAVPSHTGLTTAYNAVAYGSTQPPYHGLGGHSASYFWYALETMFLMVSNGITPQYNAYNLAPDAAHLGIDDADVNATSSDYYNDHATEQAAAAARARRLSSTHHSTNSGAEGGAGNSEQEMTDYLAMLFLDDTYDSKMLEFFYIYCARAARPPRPKPLPLQHALTRRECSSTEAPWECTRACSGVLAIIQLTRRVRARRDPFAWAHTTADLLFCYIILIMLLNLLIAMMGNTYAGVIEKATLDWCVAHTTLTSPACAPHRNVAVRPCRPCTHPFSRLSSSPSTCPPP